jgi:hypothetical protein
MVLSDNEAITIVNDLVKQRPYWTHEARENAKLNRALVLGENFCDVLIEKIEHIESVAKAKARKKYSKDIRDVFERVMKQRENVFQANGGSEKVLISNTNIKDAFIKMQSNFKANKSVFKYLSEVYFTLSDIDPNGLIFLEYKGENVYPTYKSTTDICDYLPNGQNLEYVVFEPYSKDGEDFAKRYWRIVDDVNDRIIVEIAGQLFLSRKDSFTHPFGFTPGLILSNREKIGSKIRYTQVDKIIELAKDFARDKSILNIYKFQKGYPIHWRFVTQCKKCTGLGKDGKDKCSSCDGYGYVRNTDVTDIVTIPIPDIDQPNIAPNIAGFESPDLETWKQYKEDMVDLVKVMKDTIWGTNIYMQQTTNLKETETATGRYIDVQPIINTLNVYTDEVEYVDNTLCSWLLNFIDPVKDKDEVLYYKTYGRRYIIESPDVILEKYQEAKKTSDSNTVLDKLLEEYIMSKYKNDPIMQNIMLKKKELEPYVHMSLEQVNTMFGAEEAYKKELFNKFWAKVDVYDTIDNMQTAFTEYSVNNKKEFEKTVEKSTAK